MEFIITRTPDVRSCVKDLVNNMTLAGAHSGLRGPGMPKRECTRGDGRFSRIIAVALSEAAPTFPGDQTMRKFNIVYWGKLWIKSQNY